MFPVFNIVHYIVQEVAVEFQAIIFPCLFGILLNGPHAPKQHVWLVYPFDIYRYRFVVHELPQAPPGCFHHQFKVVLLFYTECKTWQCYKLVAGSALKPRISCKYVAVVILLPVVELVGSIHKTMEEVVAWLSGFNLLVEESLQGRGLYFRRRA